ncbi:BatD family protein [Shewanella sp. KT0246]|uniref:BatD family protein n=1 Tax=Shewanella sp. KT0246 TaxID=2815912 RepID=UPI001C7C9FAA|nr:BatD family protein [Shewanella sp. KT0246]
MNISPLYQYFIKVISNKQGHYRDRLSYCLAVILMLLFVSNVALAAETPIDKEKALVVKLSVDNSKVAPGQQVNVNLLIATPSYFVDSAEFNLPVVDNALVVNESTYRASGSTMIDGKRYSSQRWSFQIYPNQPGVYSIPPMRVTAFVADDEGKPVAVTKKIQGVVLVAMQPSAMGNSKHYLVSNDVKISDDWSISNSDIKFNDYDSTNNKIQLGAGDIIERTLQIKASKTSRLTIPSTQFIVPEGVSLMLSEPELESHYNRGNSYATISQHISYSIDEPGQYNLGGETITWWDPVKKIKQQQLLVGKQIDAGGIPWQSIWLIVAGAMLVVIILFLYKYWQPTLYSYKQHLLTMLNGSRAKQISLYYQQLDSNAKQPQAQLCALNGKPFETANEMLKALYGNVKPWPNLSRRIRLYCQCSKRK